MIRATHSPAATFRWRPTIYRAGQPIARTPASSDVREMMGDLAGEWGQGHEVGKGGSQFDLSKSFPCPDSLVHPPDSQDHMKVLYEVVNYSRHFGLPTLARVSELLGLSEQQLQRRLQATGLNFTSVVGYVLSGEAVKQIALGIPLEQVARSLGYRNMTSFSRMFKKYRGLTPKQYLANYQMA